MTPGAKVSTAIAMPSAFVVAVTVWAPSVNTTGLPAMAWVTSKRSTSFAATSTSPAGVELSAA